jgi:hypothetical protein
MRGRIPSCPYQSEHTTYMKISETSMSDFHFQNEMNGTEPDLLTKTDWNLQSH